MDKPDNISQEDWYDLLRNPNDFLTTSELEKIEETVYIRRYLVGLTEKQSQDLDLILHKIVKSLTECRKHKDEPREHHIELEDGSTTDLWLTIHELHIIDMLLVYIAYDIINDPEYVEWQSIRAKILNEILRRFK